MGIDIYARWRDQSEEETDAQVTGFSSVSGNVGYLREAYHGSPYVTKYLVKEAFEACVDNLEVVEIDGQLKIYEELTEAQRNKGDYKCLGIQIEASVLRDRLPRAVVLAIYREAKLYNDGKMPEGFALNIEDKSAMKTLIEGLDNIFNVEMKDNSHTFIAAMLDDKTLETVETAIKEEKLSPDAQSFVDFVRFCEHIEKKTGEPTYIYASY